MTKPLSELLDLAREWRAASEPVYTYAEVLLAAILDNLDEPEPEPERWVLTFGGWRVDIPEDVEDGIPGAGVYASKAEARAQIRARAECLDTAYDEYDVVRIDTND